jgi:hypothetical protein
MANPKKWDSQLADINGKALVGSQQTLVGDLTIAYTTDDPGITPNGTLTIADGDATTVTRAEYNELAEEVAAKINAILDVLEAHGLMADA